MAAYLVVWNPQRWHWSSAAIDDACAELISGGRPDTRWSFGRSTKARKGDIAFLIKLGRHKRGIVGMGTLIEDTHWGRHYDPTKKGQLTYARVQWKYLVNGYRDVVIDREVLDNAPFAGQHWSSQISGIAIEPSVARALEQVLTKHLDQSARAESQSDDVEERQYHEGGMQQILVNRYERDTDARRKCIEHYGTDCTACGTSLAAIYGDVAADFIHVHHQMPLSRIGKRYKVDPINDLRPVCPNCHAIIHRRSIPFSLAEVKAMLGARRKS